MKHYKDTKGKIFAYESDGSQDHLIPSDQLPISDAQADAIRNPPMLFTDIAARYLTDVRATREAILNRLSGIGMAAIADSDTAMVTAVKAARQGLLDITKAASVTGATTLDMLKAAVLSEYRKITTTAPLTVQKAFQGVDK